MGLRRGKTKQLLENGIDCALLAVEIYNKPRAPFRVETFITHMIIAFTKVCHAHFNNTIGDKFYYKEKGKTRYKLIDGERKAWELKTCISKINFSPSVKANIEFFIKLRNKIEHRYIDKDEIGIKIFGECQSFLNNFEEFVINCFGSEYALNETLAFSLQFSRLRTENQKQASKKLLSNEVQELNEFINKYRFSLDDEVFNSQDYSVKLISIPKISNTNRSDLAIEFVNWNNLSEEDRENYNRLQAIIKDKTVVKEGINPGRIKPGEIVERVRVVLPDFSHYDHKCLFQIFSVRPSGAEKEIDSFNTNTDYCHYDEAHDDYLYQEEWADFIIKNIQSNRISKEFWKSNFNNGARLNIKDYV
ncbi:MAG: DUF3644 domain-containing protein [Crocinitomicaceae bacterium]|nr:DUF3644 domain-containing protein [Crocinitomicaceae bacterium]